MDPNKNDRLRQALAMEAAKIIATEGVRDYQQAKRKACERMGNSIHGSLPSNIEIENAISAFQHIFLSNHDEIILELRKTALVIMRCLQEFSPCLVGPVLEGTANADTPISIHVYSDVIEEVAETLEQQVIDLKIEEQRLKLGKEFIFKPTIVFYYNEHELSVTIFSLRQQHQRVKSKIKNSSMQKINLKNLEKLIATS